jgi:MSHA biogenesis protein MshE
VATVNRLLDMGAAGYMIAAALHGIVAQRLMRKICEDCAQAIEPDAHQLAWLQAQFGSTRISSMRFRAGSGCTYCNLSGYRGRVAIYELLELDRGLADAIRRGDLMGFADAARAKAGYVTLTQSAMEMATQGVTSLAEVIAVTSGLEESREALAAPATLQGDALSEALLTGTR